MQTDFGKERLLENSVSYRALVTVACFLLSSTSFGEMLAVYTVQ